MLMTEPWPGDCSVCGVDVDDPDSLLCQECARMYSATLTISVTINAGSREEAERVANSVLNAACAACVESGIDLDNVGLVVTQP